jgi:hypothetical protein
MLEIATRFWSKAGVSTPDECWEWRGSRNKTGGNYGRFFVLGHSWLAHRFSYVLATGNDPGELNVRHTCENAPCVNPSHLYLSL